MDWGCTTTSTGSKSTPNSSCASMTSRPLFMSVDESMVILAPMVQVGCCSASATVTRSSSARDLPRNGPPLAVSRMRRTSCGAPARSAWYTAECSESTGTISPPPFPRSLATTGPPAMRLSLLASASRLPCVSAARVAGRPATLAALTHGKRLALANKESLIAGGPVVAKERGNGGGEIVPVDSEHSAVYQALRAGAPHEVRRILLTASGGPFRGKSRAELERVTVADALQHPTWTMGAKITIDSSTLMNKGLEVIEAHELFGVDFDRVDVVVHPQSIVHGMVEFTDGATVAQLSQPDMRLPIGLALGAPDRLDQPFGEIDWTRLGALTFETPDLDAFPCLGLAYAAG